MTQSDGKTVIHEFGPLHSGALIRRYQRFLVDVMLDDGHQVTAYTSNPGSMKTCSRPGSRVMLTHEPGPGRKTEFTLEMIKPDDIWIGVNSLLANKLGAGIIDAGLTGRRDLEGFRIIRKEVRLEESRLDLLAGNGTQTCYIEVKNVTYMERGKALFPDAVTARGKRHLETLTRRAKKSELACNLYIVQRSDCTSFAPAGHIDPDYAGALQKAVGAGVLIVPCLFHVEPEAVFFSRTLPLVKGWE